MSTLIFALRASLWAALIGIYSALGHAPGHGQYHRGMEIRGAGTMAQVETTAEVSESQGRMNQQVIVDSNGEALPATAQVVEAAEAASREAEQMACLKKMGKVRHILAYERHYKSQHNVKLSQEEAKGFKILNRGNLSEKELIQVNQLLGKVDLDVALRSGEVWTVRDQSEFFARCLPKYGAASHLEDIATTDTGAKVIQGDMVRVPEEAASNDYVDHRATWPKGKVTYCYRAGTTTETKKVFEDAIKYIASKVPCVSFTKVEAKDSKSCKELPSVMVRDHPNGCWSHVGEASKYSKSLETSSMLNLGKGCLHRGMALHQVAQMLGLAHEATRVDATRYVDIRKPGDQGGHANYFPKRLKSPPAQAYVTDPFDLLSISMYASKAFGAWTVKPKQEALLASYLGQRMGLSELDVADLGEMYRCRAKVGNSSNNKALNSLFLKGSGLNFDGSCKDSNNATKQTTVAAAASATETDSDGEPFPCLNLGDLCKDPKNGEKAAKVCPLACLRCVPAPCDAVSAKMKLMATTTTTTTRPPPVQNCIDLPYTGIKFKSGPQASCRELLHYCKHPTLGDRVQKACPLTCGRCGLSDSHFLPVGDDGKPNCTDKGINDAPVFTVRGTATPCKKLTDFCKGHPNSDSVLNKCPKTCGRCQAEEAAKAANASASGSTTAAPSTTTRSFTVPHPGYGTSGKGVNCSRRRRWGFCMTRRRRQI